MAAPGSTQHRFKTKVEHLAERRSIEIDLLRLNKERLEIADEYKGVEKSVLKDLDRQYEKISRLGKRRINIEQEMGKLSDKIDHATSQREKKRLEGLYKQQQDNLDNIKAYESIARSAAHYAKENLNVGKKAKDVEQQRFEKAQNFLSKFGDTFAFQKRYYDVLRDSVGLEGERLMLAASVLAVFAATFEIFKKMDDSLAKFRIEMGLLRTDSKRITGDIREAATQFAEVGVNVEGAAEAVKALGNEFGGARIISKDLVETASLLKAQLGVSEESSAGFLRNISALSKSTAQAQRNMSYVAQNLTAAAGVPLNLVMQDVAKMSANTLALVSRIPMQIVKAATAARQMGTTINKMADASAQLLNFTENVQAEMEASVLVGQSVNLQLARELAYRRDIVGSTKAILAEARRINFENLDYFQMQAFAAATGRSSDELLKMIQAQRQLQEARGIEGLREEAALIDKVNSMQEAQLKNNGLQTELAVKQMANQARLVALQNQWNQLLMETLRVLYPVFDLLLKIGIIAVKIGPPIAMLTTGFLTIAKAAYSWGVSLEKVWTIFKFLSPALKGFGVIFFSISYIAEQILSPFIKLFGWLGKITKITSILSKFSFLGAFAKAIPVIGWVITAFQFLSRIIARYKEFVGTDGWFLAGIKAVGYALFDVLIQPFIDVYNWIMKWLGGHSPSQIGLSIVKGIIGVQAMIFDALTSPFRRFLAWIAEKIPGMGKLAETLRGGMTGGLQKAVTVEPKPVAVTAEAPATIKSPVIVEPTTQEKSGKEQDSNVLSEILKAINLLNSNLSSGKIGLYIDGQLLSATLARTTQFRGGYGVNNITMG